MSEMTPEDSEWADGQSPYDDDNDTQDPDAGKAKS